MYVYIKLEKEWYIFVIIIRIADYLCASLKTSKMRKTLANMFAYINFHRKNKENMKFIVTLFEKHPVVCTLRSMEIRLEEKQK